MSANRIQKASPAVGDIPYIDNEDQKEDKETESKKKKTDTFEETIEDKEQEEMTVRETAMDEGEVSGDPRNMETIDNPFIQEEDNVVENSDDDHEKNRDNSIIQEDNFIENSDDDQEKNKSDNVSKSKRKPENPADESTRHRQAKQSRVISLRKDSIISFKDRPQDDWQEARILGRAAKTTSKQFRNYFNIQPTDGSKAISINQDKYVEEIPLPKITAERKKDNEGALSSEENTELRSLIGALNWASRGTRPDIVLKSLIQA